MKTTLPFLSSALLLALMAALACSDEQDMALTPDEANSAVEAFPSLIEADGEEQAEVRVVVIDPWGRPMAGVEVVLESDRGELDQLIQPELSDGGGQTTGLVSSTTAGVAVISAWADGVLLDMRALVELVDP